MSSTYQKPEVVPLYDDGIGADERPVPTGITIVLGPVALVVAGVAGGVVVAGAAETWMAVHYKTKFWSPE
ncbi:MAG: hypothetical protein EOM23_06335 [Candidatus Moranbacteria bacterium]|nr:hypothetical protein [Candidatus Moranbacteria bacterium]